jgi:sugar phosphate isomerase/epimerase
VRFHKTIGNDTLIVPWLPEADRSPTAAGWAALGQRLDRLGHPVRMANMRLLYHNHDFEMVVLDGKPAIHWLLEAAKAENVGFEPDLAWIAHGGQDAGGDAAAVQRTRAARPRQGCERQSRPNATWPMSAAGGWIGTSSCRPPKRRRRSG